MGNTITITASDGFSFSAYQALPESTPKASVLIIQEIFGVNKHIKEVCDGYAQRGYACLLYTSPSPRDQRGSRMPSSA